MVSQIQFSLSVKLFRDMLRIRMIEEAIADRYPQQMMRCPVHLSIGQEAVAVGACSAVKKSDFLISNHRAHAHYLAKGGALKPMIAEIYGKKTGCSLGRGGSMHLIDQSVGMYGSTPIVAGSIPVGVGLAFASWMKGEEELTLIFLGEGATEEGVFAESLNFSALKKLPVLFVCENNFYSVYSPLEVRQSKERDRVAIAKAHGLYVDEGDGNDVEEVYQKTTKAVSLIRAGRGPAFLEFVTYRYREHCGPYFDNDIGYRTEAEFLDWKKKDPLDLSREKLMQEGILKAEDLVTFQKGFREEIEEAFQFALASPFPTFRPDFEIP